MWLEKSEVESFHVIDTIKCIFSTVITFILGHVEIIFPYAVSNVHSVKLYCF